MAAHQTATFAEHIHELRARLMWSLLFVAIGAGIGYALNERILHILQEPLNSSLYYTAPTGAFSFIIKLCVVFGFIVALPVVVYQAFAFFGPLLPKRTKKSIVSYALVSVILAASGIAFAYFISLPAALHFLVNFGGNSGDIQAIITADEYFNFVLAYIAGFAALFQLPLIITFINRIKPLKPSQLIGGTRYVILASFIVAAIITPTPDPLNQALMAGPIILLYFLSVVVIAIANASHRKKPKIQVPDMAVGGVEKLVDEKPAPSPFQGYAPAPSPPRPRPVVSAAPSQRPRRLVSDMVVSPSRRQARPSIQSPTRAQRPAANPRSLRTAPSSRMRVISDFIPISD